MHVLLPPVDKPDSMCTHTHTHTHQLSVTVYPAADGFLSNAIANSNKPTNPRPLELFTCPSKTKDTLSSLHVSSRDVHACGWNVRGDLTLNSMVQIHTSVTLLTSRDLAWRSGRLTCQHASQISAVAHISWDVTYVSSALQTLPVVSRNGGNAYWKSASTDLFMTPSHQIIEISIWEPTHGKG